jgi:hypothetical protein
MCAWRRDRQRASYETVARDSRGSLSKTTCKLASYSSVFSFKSVAMGPTWFPHSSSRRRSSVTSSADSRSTRGSSRQQLLRVDPHRSRHRYQRDIFPTDRLAPEMISEWEISCGRARGIETSPPRTAAAERAPSTNASRLRAGQWPLPGIVAHLDLHGPRVTTLGPAGRQHQLGDPGSKARKVLRDGAG